MNHKERCMDLTAWMEQWNMFPPKGGTILCAVSGGRDSVCLLHYLHRISSAYGFSVAPIFVTSCNL